MFAFLSGVPISVRQKNRAHAQLPFLDKLFSVLGPHTPGIVFSGGEPTIVPHFPETVALARKRGFREIAVISNGANIHIPEVQKALLANVTSIRISMYEWQENQSDHFIQTLRKIEQLRARIEKEGSGLEIGASMLTRTEFNNRYDPIGLRAIDSGIHWLYFHPYCVNWDTRYPSRANQTGVLGAVEELRKKAPPESNIQVPVERYSDTPLYFERLHGAHFLIQVGADGINYAGPECKYEHEAALLDLNENLNEDFLWHPDRLKRLDKINSDNYRFIGTRHRPPMFSDYIQRIISRRDSGDSSGLVGASVKGFAYPHII